MPDLAELNRKLDEVLTLLKALNTAPQPHMTKAEFARRLGRHPNTVHRWISRGKVITQKDGIPASELRKFVS